MMQQKKPCPNCGALVTLNISLCPSCGTALKWQVSYTPVIDPSATRSLTQNISAPPNSFSLNPTGTTAPQSLPATVGGKPWPWNRPIWRRKLLKAGLSAVAGVIWYALKPGGKERIIIGRDNSTTVDNSVKILTITVGPLVQANYYIGTSNISYEVRCPTGGGGQKPINYGIHLVDSMVQWKQRYDNELNQGPLMSVWNEVIIPPVQEKIKSAYAVICVGVADDLGENRTNQEGLASRRAANLEQVAALIRGSESRLHSLNLGQWLKAKCSQKGIDWDNQRRIVFITVDGDAEFTNYQNYVRGAAEQLREGLKNRESLAGNVALEKLLQDNETLIDIYLNCYSKSADWIVY